MRLSGLLAAVVLLLGAGGAQAAPCSGGVALADHAGKSVVLAQDTLFFATNRLELDHDGSPEAYGVRDQGLENICNGLAPLRPPECRGRNRGKCFAACQSAFAAWSRNSEGPATLGRHMCSIGLGGGGCSVPAVRLQSAPRQEWFISETAVQTSPPIGSPITGWRTSQAAQLDPALVPYFVIPGGFRRLPWDATPGDAGIAMNATTGQTAHFVVGDIGGALDEASTALHTALRGGTPPSTGERNSALGERVRSFLGGSSGDFRIAIFRHTTSRVGSSPMLTLTSDNLLAWIETTARAKLEAIGGPDRLRACTQH